MSLTVTVPPWLFSIPIARNDDNVFVSPSRADGPSLRPSGLKTSRSLSSVHSPRASMRKLITRPAQAGQAPGWVQDSHSESPEEVFEPEVRAADMLHQMIGVLRIASRFREDDDSQGAIRSGQPTALGRFVFVEEDQCRYPQAASAVLRSVWRPPSPTLQRRTSRRTRSPLEPTSDEDASTPRIPLLTLACSKAAEQRSQSILRVANHDGPVPVRQLDAGPRSVPAQVRQHPLGDDWASRAVGRLVHVLGRRASGARGGDALSGVHRTHVRVRVLLLEDLAPAFGQRKQAVNTIRGRCLGTFDLAAHLLEWRRRRRPHRDCVTFGRTRTAIRRT